MRKIGFLVLIAVLLMVGMATGASAAPNSCNDRMQQDEFLSKKLHIPSTTTLANGVVLQLNKEMLIQKDIVVYGTAADVQKYDKNESKNGITRYIGYTAGGGLYVNWEYPPDELITTDITKRNLIFQPWLDSEKNSNNSYTPIQPTWWYKLSKQERTDQLTLVLDKYHGTAAKPEGKFAELNKGKDWATYFTDYAVFSQLSTELAPGMITEMHKAGNGSLWYDNFVLDRQSDGIIGDLKIDPAFIEFSTTEPGAKATIKVKVHNSYSVDLECTTLSWRFDSSATVNNVQVLNIPAKNYRIIEITDVLIPASPKSFTANINPDKLNPPLEKTFDNNRHVWDLGEKIKTPPISFKDITPYEATVHWADLKQSELDHYELTCSSAKGLAYKGTATTFTLRNLKSSTNYSCELVALDKQGNSGGVEKNAFRTKDLPTTGDSGTGLWQSLGLIREIDNKRQDLNSIPKIALDFEKFKNATQIKGQANNHSPFFGEKLGVFGVPKMATATHTWTFSYSDQEYDSCKSRDSKGKCLGGYVTVSKTGQDYCVISYPLVGPSNWSNIKQNPTGLTLSAKDSWNNASWTLKVAGAKKLECKGSHSKNANPVQFSYYNPTEYSIQPAILINKGFNATNQKIDAAFQNLSIKLVGVSYTFIPTNLTLSGKAVESAIPFKMLWSRYGSMATGSAGA